jgi:subtilisin family serine protease
VRARHHLPPLALAVTILLVVGTPAMAGVDTTAPPSRAGRLLVRFRDGTPPAQVHAAHAAAAGAVRRHLAAISTDVVTVDDVDAALQDYRDRSDVESVEVDGRVHALAPPPDNAYDANQWNLKPTTAGSQGTLDWEPAYPLNQGSGVMVGVIDTGFKAGGFDEPLFVRYDIDYDFVGDGRGHPDDDASDDNGHGTHITGTIAQRTGNPATTSASGLSVAGVAPAAQILPVKVLDHFGEGSVSDTAAGILYAVKQGAKVINLSLGGDYSPTLCAAVAIASQSALVVAASGNESGSGFIPVAYPAACPGALAIGGLRYNGTRAPYSNAGCELAATAPGGDFSSNGRLFPPRPGGGADTRDGILQETYDFAPVDGSPPHFGLFLDAGTSMAAAHAAGAAAVLLGINPDIATVRRILLRTARDLGPASVDDEYGSGGIDLAAAVAALQAGDTTPPADALGYWMVASDGGIFSFGNAPFLGSTGDLRLNSPIVGMARTVTGRGYWLVAADGGIFTFGDAQFFGSTGNLKLVKPIVGMAATGTGNGYWLVASDGGIFAFGDARFYGSTGGQALRAPIVAMATDRTAGGYWLVASDGGIFAFGDAPFLGSMGGKPLNRPIVTITPTPTGAGYWLAATDGGIFAFGDAGFFGSTGNIVLNKPIVTMTSTCYGTGYWMVASDGGVFSFGNAPFLGSTGDIALNKPIVGSQLAIDHRFSQG